jgi:hypothetical protein
MPKGVKTNLNPSPETRFGGPRGNPIGRTSEQRQAEIRNAWIATEIRERMLNAVAAVLKESSDLQTVNLATEASILRLLKDSEDRGLGTPKSSLDVTTNGKDIAAGVDLSALSDEALAEIVAARDATAED